MKLPPGTSTVIVRKLHTGACADRNGDEAVPAVRYHEGRFPPSTLDWNQLLPLIGPAHAALARYEGLLHGIPNAHVLLSPLFSQEAVLSSRIEGTQATLGQVLEYEAAADTASGDKRDDIQEVLNYRLAMRHAVDALKQFHCRNASCAIPIAR